MPLSALISGMTFVLSMKCWRMYDSSSPYYQMVQRIEWMSDWNLSLGLGVDGISRFFIRLNCFLTPLCMIGSKDNIQHNQATYYGLFLILSGLVNMVFLALDLLTFYLSFEAVLIPMFYIIGMWGSRERKVRAAFFFFRYTLIGSLFLLLAMLKIYSMFHSRDIVTLMGVAEQIPVEMQRWMWLAFFFSFAVKVPMLPVHIWLPEAHVEAPTAGSVILAGILLKLGTYGMIRVLLGVFPEASVYFTPLVMTLAVMAVVYTSLTAIRQTDMKRIIAYASVAHMNMTIVGLFSLTSQGVLGALLQMLSHGLVSGALFFCVGVLYDRHHSRLVQYYGGVAQTMPMFVTVFLFFTRANIAIPGTSSFVGEFMILVGIFLTNPFVAVMSATGMVLGGAYSLYLFNRRAYGNMKIDGLGVGVSVSTDLNRREALTFRPLIVMTLVMGIYPDLFLDSMTVSVDSLIDHVRDTTHVYASHG